MELSDDARRLWETALALNRRAAAVSPAAGRLPPLLFFTDPARTPEPWRTAARLPPGAGVVFRSFGLADRDETARRLRETTMAAGVRLLIGLDAELADRVGADGVHLPERALALAPALRRDRPGWLLTGAAHGAAAVAAAGALDALVLSPVFPPGGASAGKPTLGVEGFNALAGASALPAYALGGVNAGNVDQLDAAQACGIAGVDAIAAAFKG